MPENLRQKSTWFYADLPITDYKDVWELQGRFVSARKERRLDRDIVLLSEHYPVFTLGRRGGLENLVVSPEFLEKQGIAVIQVERGGNITFHAPGQLIVYPIIDLKQAGLRVVKYVDRLEEIMIRTARDWEIIAERNPLNRGIWIGNKKLGSIGVAVRRSITFHGFALNVNLSLEPFEWINPCGIRGIGVTSMSKELSQEISMNQVRHQVIKHIESVFNIVLKPLLTKTSEVCGN